MWCPLSCPPLRRGKTQALATGLVFDVCEVPAFRIILPHSTGHLRCIPSYRKLQLPFGSAASQLGLQAMRFRRILRTFASARGNSSRDFWKKVGVWHLLLQVVSTISINFHHFHPKETGPWRLI